MRFGNNQSPKENENYDTVGPEDVEIAGPGGPNLIGGDVTPHQDASEVADAATQARVDSGKMEQRQQSGEVGQQREDLHPAAEDSAGGNQSDGAGDGAITGNSMGDGAKKNSEFGSQSESFADESFVNENSVNGFAGESGNQSELSEAKTQLLHLAADFENFKRQAARREQETRERAVRGVLEDLLPVLDNFERAVGAAQNTSDVNSLKVGVEYILQQFQDALKESGAVPIEAVGKPFDPSRHEALEEIESELAPGTIVNEVQAGYVFKDKVLRPSRVRVAK